MPAPRISMRSIKDVLRLTQAGLSQRQIADSLGISHGVVGKYQQLAKQSQLAQSELAALSETELAEKLLTQKSFSARSPAPRSEPDFAYIHSQLKLKGARALAALGRVPNREPERLCLHPILCPLPPVATRSVTRDATNSCSG